MIRLKGNSYEIMKNEGNKFYCNCLNDLIKDNKINPEKYETIKLAESSSGKKHKCE